MSHPRVRSQGIRADATAWAIAFVAGFSAVDPDLLGRVRLKKSVALNDTLVAVVYDDRRGDVTGRVYDVHELNEINEHGRDPAASAMGIVVGELIEPTKSGVVRDAEPLQALNDEFPGLQWLGSVPDS